MFTRKFNLNEYERNKFKVVTANGLDVRIICTDRMTTSFTTKNKRVVVALEVIEVMQCLEEEE